MLGIHTVVSRARIPEDITTDNALDIAMDFVRDVYGESDAPTAMVLAVELGQRAEVIRRILMGCVERLPEGKRTSGHLAVEISPREIQVCGLVARGDIDLRPSEVQ